MRTGKVAKSDNEVTKSAHRICNLLLRIPNHHHKPRAHFNYPEVDTDNLQAEFDNRKRILTARKSVLRTHKVFRINLSIIYYDATFCQHLSFHNDMTNLLGPLSFRSCILVGVVWDQ